MKSAIVGAGIMGQLLAWNLLKKGYQVSLFDNNNRANCSMAAAGLLAPVTELPKSTWLNYEMGRDALEEHWPRILSELHIEIYLKRLGILTISHPQDRSDLIQFIKHIDNKIPTDGKLYYEKLNQEQLHVLEPQLSKFEEAFYFPSEAHIDTQNVLTVLQANLLKQGVIWRHLHVDNVFPGKVKANDKFENFDMVFDCRGLGAKSIFEDLQAVRGELVWLYAPDVEIKRPIRLQHPRYSLYLAPRNNHIYLVGATEIYAEDYSEISVRSILELLTAVFYVHPGFSEARIVKTVSHCRPAFSDHHPRIRYTDGLIAINGLYRHGFLIAPTLADEVVRWLNETSSIKYPQIGEFYDKYSIQ